MPASELARRLQEGPCVLDGATGTELERRGVSTALPLWSAAALWEHPEVVRDIHADYAQAGVGLLTANTFRTQRRVLQRAGRGTEAAAFTARAVELARQGAAAATRRPLVLGSAPTLEDCYRPEDVPEDALLVREHLEHARHLPAAGVDAILIETMNTIREARAAVHAAREVGLPFVVSFVCWQGAHLLSGERLADALAAVATYDPAAVCVNCLPPSNVEPCLAILQESGMRFGVYANLGEPEEATGFRRREDCSPSHFATHTARWLAAGSALVGGCCGTTPAHLRAVVQTATIR